MRAWAKTFALVAGWDWLATMGTIYMAERSWLAVPMAVLLTAFWWAAIQLVVRERGLIIPGLAGAAIGTAVGVTFP